MTALSYREKASWSLGLLDERVKFHSVPRQQYRCCVCRQFLIRSFDRRPSRLYAGDSKIKQHIIVLDRVPFLDSLKRIGLLASERTHGVRVELTDGLMTLLSDNPEFGKAREEIEIDYTGGDLIIAFNAKYVTEILATLSAAKIEMALNEALSPGLFREHGNDEYLFVVMPMRL